MDGRAGDAGLAGVWLWIDTLSKRDGLEQEEDIHCFGYRVKAESDSQKKRSHFTSIRWVIAAGALVGRASVFGLISPRARVVSCPSFAARVDVE